MNLRREIVTLVVLCALVLWWTVWLVVIADNATEDVEQPTTTQSAYPYP